MKIRGRTLGRKMRPFIVLAASVAVGMSLGIAGRAQGQGPAPAARLPSSDVQVRPGAAATTVDRAATREAAQATPAAQMPSQVVRIAPERLEGIDPGIRAREEISIISAAGVDTGAVVGGALQLRRGQFAVLAGRVMEVEGPIPASAGEIAGTDSDLPFVTLPFRFVTPDSALTGEWVLRPIYKIANRLRWNPAGGQFEGLLLLAVEDTTRRSESRPIRVPIRFEFLSDAESIDPTQIAIEHTNFPLQPVQIAARFAEDSLRVHVVPEFDINGVDIWIPVQPSLALSAPARIQGWGIETARVVARVVGTASARPSLALTTTAGALDSVRLATDASGSAETHLRSEGLGEATIAVGGPGFSTATVNIEFVFPWIFLLAALLGGAFGGIGSVINAPEGAASGKWARGAAKGVFAGMLAALAWYALGISLLQFDLGIQRFNEFAVFTLAALGGYFGIPKPKPASS